MTNAEKKLNTLKKGKNKMVSEGNRTSEVENKASAVKTSFQDYIKSDNLDATEYVTKQLKIVIEEHRDFEAALYCINRAITNAQTKVNEEKSAAQASK